MSHLRNGYNSYVFEFKIADTLTCNDDMGISMYIIVPVITFSKQCSLIARTHSFYSLMSQCRPPEIAALSSVVVQN